MRDLDFNRHFDMNSILNDDAIWLSMQVKIPTKDFTSLASKMLLRQEDWDKFWKEVRKIEYKQIEKIGCIINDIEYRFTEEEFEFVKRLFGEPLYEVSNCCGAEVDEHNDHTSRCKECKEGCSVIYVWEF
jgi:hypothetical protein